MGVLDVDEVTVRFGGVMALDSLSFTVERGEFALQLLATCLRRDSRRFCGVSERVQIVKLGEQAGDLDLDCR